MEKELISARIERELFDKLEIYCKENNLTVSEALRKILLEKLNRKEGFFYRN